MLALAVRVPLDDRVWTTIAFICEGALLSRATLSRLKLSSSCGERLMEKKIESSHANGDHGFLQLYRKPICRRIKFPDP